ncbi:helix-turn-helix domain-containing protein [Raineyella fluvialis]|uniref:helix-turn-helix domain-containing protein n=1 Tax=Raineyella fluvialis TaxID=2662261 RepID=UPI00188FBCC3|nr:helix-turn-helix domain-containing protein [Raineyella fluvialis]
MGVQSDEAGGGMVPDGNGSRLSGEARERLMLTYVRRYRNGRTIASLAEDSGRTEAFVESLLREAGVSLRLHAVAASSSQGGTDPVESPAGSATQPRQLDDQAVVGPSPGDTAPPGTGAALDPAVQTTATRDVIRDLARSPGLTRWGLPTPPLSVLVRKKDKAWEKKVATAAAKARRKQAAAAKAAAGAAGDPPFAGKKSGSGTRKSGKKSTKKSGHR